MIERWNVDGAGDEVVAPIAPHATALHGESALEQIGEVAPDAATGDAPEAVGGGVDTPVKKNGRWGRRVAWVLAMVSMGAILGGVIIFVLKFIDGPAVTTQSTTLEKLHATPVLNPTLSLWGGKYAEMKYPGLFDQMGAAPGNKNALEAYNFSSKSSYSMQLSVAVTSLPSGSLDDDASYKFRTLSSAAMAGNTEATAVVAYTQKKITLMGEPAVEMIKPGGGEVTLFWAHKGMLLTISASTDNPGKDKVATYMAQIEPTIRWRS